MNGAVYYPANQLTVSHRAGWSRIAETVTRVNQPLAEVGINSRALVALQKSAVRVSRPYSVMLEAANPAWET
jgi:hypothetical protein